MNFKNFEEEIKIYEQIKALDAEIAEINRFAMTIANNEVKASFGLKLENLHEVKEEKQNIIYEDGSPRHSVTSPFGELFFMSPFDFMRRQQEKKSAVKEQFLEQQLSEKNIMAILDYILREKKMQRGLLMNKLDVMRKLV